MDAAMEASNSLVLVVNESKLWTNDATSSTTVHCGSPC